MNPLKRQWPWVLANGIVVLAFSSANGQKAPQLEDKLNAYMLPYVESMNFTGAVLVAKGGRILLRKGYGMADIKAGLRNSPETSFPVGQLSESFTAAGILLLEQQGKLKVTDSLANYIPDFPDSNKITIEALLTQTTSIPNVAELRDYEEKSRSPHTLEQTVNWLKSKPPKSTARSLYTYSSSDYILLARIIEKVSGKTYGEFLQESIFGPLRMKDTADWFRVTRGSTRASRYVSSGARSFEKVPDRDWSILTGSGSMFTSVDDLYKWDRELYRDSVLDEASKRKMFAEQPQGYGYGWHTSAGPWKGLNVKRSIIINARAPGLGANIERFPDEDVCVILLTNVFDSLAHSISDDLAAIALGEDRTPAAPATLVHVNPTVLETYAGRYQFEDLFGRRMVVEVKTKGDTIALSSETMPLTDYLVPRSDTAFVDRLYGGALEFTKSADGKVRGVVWKLSKEYKGQKIN